MGWKNKLAKFAPIALKLGLGGAEEKGEAVSELVGALHSSLAGSPQKASIDTVKIVAAAVDDHEENIQELRAANKRLEERLSKLENK